jgi:hypothetical protein
VGRPDRESGGPVPETLIEGIREMLEKGGEVQDVASYIAWMVDFLAGVSANLVLGVLEMLHQGFEPQDIGDRLGALIDTMAGQPEIVLARERRRKAES